MSGDGSFWLPRPFGEFVAQCPKCRDVMLPFQNLRFEEVDDGDDQHWPARLAIWCDRCHWTYYMVPADEVVE